MNVTTSSLTRADSQPLHPIGNSPENLSHIIKYRILFFTAGVAFAYLDFRSLYSFQGI